MKSYHYCCFVILLLFLQVSVLPLGAQEKDIHELKDKELITLCSQIEDSITDLVVWKKIELFHQLALRKNNRNAIVESLQQKLFYHALVVGKLDSAAVAFDQFKVYCKGEFPEKIFRAHRYLIYGYLDADKNNKALIECKKLLLEVEDKKSLVESYLIMLEIYNTMGQIDLAIEYAQKGYDFICENQQELKAYKLCLMAAYLCLLNAEVDNKRSDQYYLKADSIYQKYGAKDNSCPALKGSYARFIYYAQAQNLIMSKRYNEAGKFLTLLRKDPEMDAKRYYYSTLTKLNRLTGKYAQALNNLDSLIATKQQMNIYSHSLNDERERASLYLGMKQYEKAATVYEAYIVKRDTAEKINARHTIAEFANIMEVERINMEKQQSELAQRKSQIVLISFILALVLVLLAVSIWFYLHQRAMTKALRESADSLAKENQKVVVANGMKDAFIQNMSHEIRTPLNSIVGFSQYLASKFSKSGDEEMIQLSAIIETNSASLLKLMDNVIEISKLDTDTTGFEIAAVNVDDICHTAIEMASYRKKEGIALLFSPQGGEIEYPLCAERLRQVLFNLLDNAVKFTNTGSITLEWHQVGERLEFTITDTGCGISVDKQEWVFERFARVDEYTPGAGLGLSFARIIVERMGGTIAFDPSYTGGSRIRFSIIPAYG